MEPEVHKKPIRFYEIDLLRFLAALSVVCYHWTYYGHVDKVNPLEFPALDPVTRYGYLGVQLFFIISGYVVLLSATGKTVQQFFISRVSRLYPAFWIACTLTFLVKVFSASPIPHLQAGPMQYVYNMTMLHEFLGILPVDGSYWSLSVEITFYFLISLLIAYGLLKHLDWLMAMWLIYALMPGLTHGGVPFAWLFFPRWAPYFVAGMLFYLLQQPQGRTLLRYVLLAVSYLAALRSSFNQAAELTLFHHHEFSRIIVASLVTGFYLVFYLIAFRKIDFSNQRWLANLGALTYPLYLIHSDIAYIVFNRVGFSINKYLLEGGLLLLVLLMAYLIHKLFEKRLGKWLSMQLDIKLLRLGKKA